LVEPATNDIGRARSFFVWIASQRLQNIVDFVDNTLPPEDSPLYTVLLMLLKQWGNGYSEIFSNLCRYIYVRDYTSHCSLPRLRTVSVSPFYHIFSACN